MGLFDKKVKKNEGIDSGPVTGPVIKKAEEIHDVVEEVAEPAVKSQPIAVAPVPAPPPAPAPAPIAAPIENEHPDYGINKAIELMRMLPDDNMELVVCVVKRTLESTNVNVTTIINDATRKQAIIEARIEVLAREIAGFESEVAIRKREIGALEADYKETSTVKDWLVVAETLSTPKDASKQNGKDAAAKPPPIPGSAAAVAASSADNK